MSGNSADGAGYTSSIASLANSAFSWMKAKRASALAPVSRSTERDVLSWASRGKTVPDTAEILSLSEETIDTHMRHAMHKLGANNKTHAVVKAIYLGLIDV